MSLFTFVLSFLSMGSCVLLFPKSFDKCLEAMYVYNAAGSFILRCNFTTNRCADIVPCVVGGLVGYPNRIEFGSPYQQ